MSNVQRYTESCGEGGGVVESSTGEYVSFADYDALRERLAEAERLLRKVCKEDWSGAKTAHIEEFLANTGCADGEKL